jgi:hypothetical protein
VTGRSDITAWWGDAHHRAGLSFVAPTSHVRTVMRGAETTGVLSEMETVWPIIFASAHPAHPAQARGRGCNSPRHNRSPARARRSVEWAPVDEQHDELLSIVGHAWLYTAMAGTAPAAPNPGSKPR